MPEETHISDPPRHLDTGDELGAGPDRAPATSAPRWVAVLGVIIAILLILAFVVLHVTGTLGPGAH